MFTSRISYSVVVYVMSMILLFISKPDLAFESNGELRTFGVSEKKDTIYSVGVLAVTMAIVIYYLFCMIDLLFE